MSKEQNTQSSDSRCFSRRGFLSALGRGATTTFVVLNIPGVLTPVRAQVSLLGRQKVAALTDLKKDTPLYFKYPGKDPVHSTCMIVKLGQPAGMGVGPQKDIVAYHTLCTHMGGPLQGTYHYKYKSLGPCPFHLTTFDLTRHGMVISGHATESLPQVVLSVEGGDVVATGVLGLVYGAYENKKL